MWKWNFIPHYQTPQKVRKEQVEIISVTHPFHSVDEYMSYICDLYYVMSERGFEMHGFIHY
jgi:hypothetical protein